MNTRCINRLRLSQKRSTRRLEQARRNDNSGRRRIQRRRGSRVKRTAQTAPPLVRGGSEDGDSAPPLESREKQNRAVGGNNHISTRPRSVRPRARLRRPVTKTYENVNKFEPRTRFVQKQKRKRTATPTREKRRRQRS